MGHSLVENVTCNVCDKRVGQISKWATYVTTVSTLLWSVRRESVEAIIIRLFVVFVVVVITVFGLESIIIYHAP